MLGVYLISLSLSQIVEAVLLVMIMLAHCESLSVSDLCVSIAVSEFELKVTCFSPPVFQFYDLRPLATFIRP